MARRLASLLLALAVLAASVAVPTLLGVALAGCPRLPAPDGCAPRAYRCHAGAPWVCSASQRWTRIGDLPCAEVGLVCVVLDGLARCAPVTGGAP